MEIQEKKAIIEAILFATGRIVTVEELMLILEITKEEIEDIIKYMKDDYINRGIEIIKVDNGYQLCTKKEYYEYIYQIIDKRAKPNLSPAALETLAIIAYNPRISRAEIESIRGVSSDACMYKLLEFGLIEESGKLDAPGKPMSYQTTKDFLKMFGYQSLEELPELPKYKLDENKQIVIDDIIEKESIENKNTNQNIKRKEEEEEEESQNIVDIQT